MDQPRISSRQRGREAREGFNHTPKPWSPRRRFTLWMDYKTGQGVDSNGNPFSPQISRGRKHPTLRDKLDTAARVAGPTEQQVRIMLTGAVPPNDRDTRHWLLVRTPGWVTPRGHWLGTPPTGRFTNEVTEQHVEVRTAAEWFGDGHLTPQQARDCWGYLESEISHVFGDRIGGSDSSTPLLLSPAATGTNLWAASLPPNLDPVPLRPDIAELLHSISGQHHQDHLVTGPGLDRHPDVGPMIDTRTRPTLDGFSYVDGRFMYASLCHNLGKGPGLMLSRAEAFDLWQTDKYFRGFMRVRFTIPDTWDHIGILGVQHPDMHHGWFYPNRPRTVHETWAEASELYWAERFGWGIEPIEAIVLDTKMESARKRFHNDETTARRHTIGAKPLDEWARKLTALRENTANHPQLHPQMVKACGAALRAILIQGIGAFASRGRSSTIVTYDPASIPSDAQVTQKGEAFIYQRPVFRDQRSQQFYHPEFAAQVWGRGRAKVMYSNASGTPTGALTLDPSTVIGINGDAVYTSTTPPTWSLPTDQGGADDGKVGRLRLQGYLPGPLPAPGSRAERDQLRAKAVSAGTELPDTDLVDQGQFRLEFDTVDDRADRYDHTDAEDID